MSALIQRVCGVAKKWCIIMAAAVLGCLYRGMRRLLGMPPRVVHGIAPLHSLNDSVLADRRNGVKASSVVLYARQVATYDLTTEKDFDVVFSRSVSESTDKQWRCLCHLLLHADIWHASFCPLWPAHYLRTNRWAMRLIRWGGIRIIAYPYGIDCAGRDRSRDRFDWIGALQKDYPSWDLREHFLRAKANTDLFCRFANLIIGMDGSVRRFLPRNDVYCKTIPVDTHRLRPSPDFKGSDVPVIVHAPNHRHVKGTQFLLDALDLIRAAGIPYELRLVERVARAQAIEIYRSADVIADQFVMGAYGVFALECLALGKPVMTYLDHDHLSSPVFNLPLVNTNRWNLPYVLAVLLLVPQLRSRLGYAGREAVVRYQSLEAIGEIHKVMYEHVWRGAPLDLDNTQHFSVERTCRSFTEDPRDSEFWPVPVEDIQKDIHSALRRLASPNWLTDAVCQDVVL